VVSDVAKGEKWGYTALDTNSGAYQHTLQYHKLKLWF